MAHLTQVVGTVSELTATGALLANGWEVSHPVVDEKYDIVAKDPVNGEFRTMQIKTVRRRTDRNNEMVIYSTNGRGQPYHPSDCDYIVGVEDNTVYMFENTGKKEYWASDVSAVRRWVKLTSKREALQDGR